MNNYFDNWDNPKFNVNNLDLQEFKDISKDIINTTDYNRNPIKIKIKDYNFLCFWLFFGCLSSLCFFYYLLFIAQNKFNRITMMIMCIIVYFFIDTYKKFTTASKSKNSYMYFKNNEITQKNKSIIIKQFKISDIKSITKSFKHFNMFNTENIPKNQLWFLPIAIIMMLSYIIYFMTSTDILAILIPVISFLFFLIFGFRLADGLNLDILRNNVLIQTDDDRIILLNLKKSEFDELKEYFRNFNLVIK